MSSDVPKLTKRALSKILAGFPPEQIGETHLQILQIKKLPSEEGEKFRILLSDGVEATPFVVYHDKISFWKHFALFHCVL